MYFTLFSLPDIPILLIIYLYWAKCNIEIQIINNNFNPSKISAFCKQNFDLQTVRFKRKTKY